MARYNWPLFVGTLIVSVLATILLSLWSGQWLFLGLLLLLPFGLPRRRREPRPAARPACPACGYEAADASESFCPRHGTRLV